MNDRDRLENEVADWWSTDIIYMRPGVIRYRGYPIEELIGNVTFAQMIWLLTRGELPDRGQGELLDIALMSAVDHGPQAPSIAVARMAATCGVGLNNAIASAVNVLGDVHGGAGEQAVDFYMSVAERIDDDTSLEDAVTQSYDAFVAGGGKFVPGFGHRFHDPVDPRAPRLLEMVDQYAAQGTVSGRYAELGFPAPLARGLFCLSRSVGILAHAWEQTQQGGRNKGPIPRHMIWRYTGPNPRAVETKP